MYVVVLRIEPGCALEIPRGQRRLFLLKRDLTEQDIRTRRSFIQPDCLLKHFGSFLVSLQSNVGVTQPPVNKPDTGVDGQLLLEFVNSRGRIALVKADLTEKKMSHRELRISFEGTADLRYGTIIQPLPHKKFPEHQVRDRAIGRHGKNIREGSAGVVPSLRHHRSE